MWCLARTLPLIFGDTVPEEDENWMNFLLLLKIVDYVFAPVTSSGIAAYLSSLIEDYLETFKELYPECPIIPKQHYMIHIPEWMVRYVKLFVTWYYCKSDTFDFMLYNEIHILGVVL